MAGRSLALKAAVSQIEEILRIQTSEGDTDKRYDERHDGISLGGPWEENGHHCNGVDLTQC